MTAFSFEVGLHTSRKRTGCWSIQLASLWCSLLHCRIPKCATLQDYLNKEGLSEGRDVEENQSWVAPRLRLPSVKIDIAARCNLFKRNAIYSTLLPNNLSTVYWMQCQWICWTPLHFWCTMHLLAGIGVVSYPSRWSLLFVFGFLWWSSSWQWLPHIAGCKLCWPLLRAGLAVFVQFVYKMYFFYVSRGRKKIWATFYETFPLIMDD